jgi:hypothetical protein
MLTRFRRKAPVALAALLVSLAPTSLPAQAGLPEAGTLIQRYVDAIGGRDAVLRPRMSRTTGTFEMPGAGLRGDMEMLMAPPNRMMSTVTIPGMGTMRSGYDGDVAWAVDPMMGARLMSGGELESTREQANTLASIRDAGLFTTRETVERTEIGGQPCYKVRLVWKSGRESFDCYSTETGLLIASIGKQESPMGSIEVTTRYADYREFGGVRMPTRMTMEMMGQQQIMTISNVEYDTVDAAAFELPAEIRALRGG